MLCKRLLKTAARLGTVSKYTFVNGRGITPKELNIMNKEAQGKYNPNLPDLPEQGYIPVQYKGHQTFFYDTELFAFVNRIGTEPANIKTVTELLNIAFSHHTTDDPAMVAAAQELNSKGCKEISHYLYKYHKKMYPNLPMNILQRLSKPLKCLPSHSYYVMTRVLCMHELVRIELDEKRKRNIANKIYWQAIGGVYMSLKHGENADAAKNFIHTFVLNHYATLDLRYMIVKVDAKKSLTRLLDERGMFPPVERLTNEVGVGTKLATYVVGIFSGDDLLAQAADYKKEQAIEEAWVSSLASLLLEEDHNAAPVYARPPDDEECEWIQDLVMRSKVPDVGEPEEGLFSASIKQFKSLSLTGK